MKAFALVALLVLAGCQTMPVEDPRQVWCEMNKPFPKLPDVAVAMLDRETKIALVAYQLRGEKWCGWPE
jgi:hypothetical protein